MAGTEQPDRPADDLNYVTVTTERSSCDAAVRLTDEEFRHLDNLLGAMHEVPSDVGCYLWPGHSGAHLGFGQQAFSGDWWVRWDRPAERAVVILQRCRAERPDPADARDSIGCILPDGHEGLHLM